MVLKSVVISKGGEVFVTKMPVVKIPDLAEVMIDILAPKYGYKPSEIKTIEIGAKPGEKFYEELMSEEEVTRSMELKDMFVITPAFKSIYQSINYKYPETVSSKVHESYISAAKNAMENDELKQFLIINKVLEKIAGSWI